MWFSDYRTKLSNLRQLPARRGWLDGTRAQLAAYIVSRSLLPGEHRISHQFRLATPLAAALTALLLIMVGATGVAAQHSLPHEVLYPVKLAVERVELAVTLGRTERVQIRLKHADARLAEVGQLTDRPPELVVGALARYEGEVVATSKLVSDASIDQPSTLSDIVRKRLVRQQQFLQRINEETDDEDDGDEQRKHSLIKRVAVMRALKASSEGELASLGVELLPEQSEANSTADEVKAKPPESGPDAAESLYTTGAAIPLPPNQITDLVVEVEMKVDEARGRAARLEAEDDRSPKLNKALMKAEQRIAEARNRLSEASPNDAAAMRSAYRRALKAYQLELEADISASEPSRRRRDK